MAFGDVGGAVTELIVTCQTPDSGTIAITKGDALKLTGPYTVSNAADAEDVIFGQAMASASANGAAIPVKVRGICLFAYTGDAPTVDGVAGIVAADAAGVVKAPASGNGVGRNLRVNTTGGVVHVLL